MSWNDEPDYTPQVGPWHVLVYVLLIGALVWWVRGDDILRALNVQ